MRHERPRRPVRRRNRGVLWACVFSGLAHAGLLGLILLRPGHLPVETPLLQSYTVDLVSADVLGGDSGPVLGPRGAGLPSAAAAAVEEPPAPEPEVADVVEEESAPEVAAAEAEEKVAPPLESDDDPDAVALAPKATDVPPTATPRPVAPTATRAVPPTAAAPTAAPTSVAKPTVRPPTVAKPTPIARLTPTAKATVASKAPTAIAASPRPAGATPTARSAVAKAVKTPAVAPTLTLDQQIAEAVKRRAQAAGSGAGDETDRKIAEAVQRRAAQVGSGTGGGTEPGGGSTSLGPLGSGPGSGSGGAVRGIEYILYKRTMEERIREAWAWAGADDSLQCVVRFSVASDGEISAIRTTRSSGDPAYDNSAERAVRAANPLRPIPDDYRNEFADVELTFRARDLKR